MRFAFTDEQLEFRDAVRDLLAKECSAQHLRDAWTNDTGRIPGLWQQLADMGVVGMLAPEAHGGLGMNELDLVLILEETGRVALPEPIVETAAVAVPFLQDIPDNGAAVWTPDELAPWADTASAHIVLSDAVALVQP